MRSFTILFSLQLFALSGTAHAQREDWRSCAVTVCSGGECDGPKSNLIVVSPANFADSGYGGEAAMMEQLAALAERLYPASQGWSHRFECNPKPGESYAMDQAKAYIQLAQAPPASSEIRIADPSEVWNHSGDAAIPMPTPLTDGETRSGSHTKTNTSEQDGKDDHNQRPQAGVAKRTDGPGPKNGSEKQNAAHDDQTAQHEREIAAQKVRDEFDRQHGLGKASTDTDANRCVTTAQTRLNDTFQGNTSASIVNGCGQPVDVRICLMTNKGWNCGVRSGVAPQASASFSSFDATGQVFVDAKVSGSAKALASPN